MPVRASRFKNAAVWLACGLAAVFCIYRIAVFVPQPLDSPDTLRPVLNRWFIAFLMLYRRPETAYAHWRNFCLIAMLLPSALAILNYAREDRNFTSASRTIGLLCSRSLLFACIAGSLVLCRYPTLLDYQLNPDEAEFLSAAHKLFYDGNFFRSVDCGTSGPVNIYPLMLPAIAGISPDYASSRLLVLLIAFSVIYLSYRAFRLLTTDSLARIAILPLAAAFAGFQHPNLVHYSSEQIPLLLIAAALYITVRVLRDPAMNRVPLLLLGLLIMLGFFSKMQSVPIIAAFAAVALLYTHATGKAGSAWLPGLLLSAGAASLLALHAAFSITTGVWGNFVMSYIVSNQRYTELQSNFLRDLPGFVNYLVGTDEIRFFLFTFLALVTAYTIRRSMAGAKERSVLRFAEIGSAAIIIIAIISLSSAPWVAYLYLALIGILAVRACLFLIHSARCFGTDSVRWLGLLSVLLVSAALFSIYKPHRNFPHYLLFLLAPVTVAIAWMLIRQTRPRVSGAPAKSGFLLLLVTLTVTQQTYVWGSQDARGFQNVVPTIRAPGGDLIRSLTRSKGRIAVWGWTADPYLGSGRVPATRDLNLFYFFLAPPEITSYYRARFLQDMLASPAELFIDAVGPVSWFVSDPVKYRYEQFPEIAAFINQSYVHLTDRYGYRYFLRRDLAMKVSPHLTEVCALSALRCADMQERVYSPAGSLVTVVKQLPAVEMPAHALIEAKFTPMARQTENSTVFTNEATPGSFRGLRFHNIGGDRYRLLLGLGHRWGYSKSILLPPGKPVSLSIERNGKDVFIRSNGVAVDDMHLASPMADTSGPILLGSWIDGKCRFTGTIPFFQIVDLEREH